MKIVINTCYGGFILSPKAIELYAKKKGIPCYWFKVIHDRDKDGRFFSKYVRVDTPEKNAYSVIPFKVENPEECIKNKSSIDKIYILEQHQDKFRTDPVLIEVIEELKEEANGDCTKLKIVEVPDDVKWYISEYDGIEQIHESHRIWD